LPCELGFKVIDYLDVKTLLVCIRTCSSWKNLIESEGAQIAIWKKRLLQEGFASEKTLLSNLERFKGKNMILNDAHGIIKAFYCDQYKTRQNWILGRYRKLSFPAHGESVVTCLQFDEDKIITGSDDQTIQIYDIKKGELITRLEGHNGGVWGLQYWNSTLVSGSTDRTLRIWYR